jgi:type II secretory ATPase GspE/PulE/Tfp pilus assembly ATPase PilB-like protein
MDLAQIHAAHAAARAKRGFKFGPFQMERKIGHVRMSEVYLVGRRSPEDAKSVVPNRGKGCEKCNNTGFKGRVGLYEVMDITEELRELILVGASTRFGAGGRGGMITLRQSGLRKVKEGVTTIDEVVRETMK